MQKEEIVYFLNHIFNSYEGFMYLGAIADAKKAAVADVLSESVEEMAELIYEDLSLSLYSSAQDAAAVKTIHSF